MKNLNKINDGDDVQEQELLVEDIDSQEQTPGRNHAAQLAIVMQMSRQETRSSAGPDHVTLQALITWLMKSRSRD